MILPLVGRSGGRIIDTAGHGILAEFPSMINPTECAVEIRAIMATRNEEVLESRRMQCRIGINLGDVIHDETRIYGDGINVAAWLEGIAEPGAVCDLPPGVRPDESRTQGEFSGARSAHPEILDRALVGTLDLIERDGDGRVVVVGIKTSARKYTDLQVEPSLQLSTYSSATAAPQRR